MISPYSKAVLLTAIFPPLGYFYISSFGFYKKIFPILSTSVWVVSCVVWLLNTDNLTIVITLNNLLLLILLHQFEWPGQIAIDLLRNLISRPNKARLIDENRVSEMPPNSQRTAALIQATLAIFMILSITPVFIIQQSIVLWIMTVIVSIYYLMLSLFCYALPDHFVKKSYHRE